MSLSLKDRSGTRPVVQLLARVDPALKERLARAAQAAHKPQTRLVEEALRALLDEREESA